MWKNKKTNIKRSVGILTLSYGSFYFFHPVILFLPYSFFFYSGDFFSLFLPHMMSGKTNDCTAVQVTTLKKIWCFPVSRKATATSPFCHNDLIAHSSKTVSVKQKHTVPCSFKFIFFCPPVKAFNEDYRRQSFDTFPRILRTTSYVE